jgi:UDP-N-acetylmuramoylalanine--D-glutamate ligase
VGTAVVGRRSDLREAAARFRARRVAVLGLQRSNAAVVRYLLRLGAAVEAFDLRPRQELLPYAAELPAEAPLFTGPEYLHRLAERLDGLAAIFVTPGVRKDLPVLRQAEDAGVPLWTEAAFVLEHAPCPVIGITGSAGKTTTTTLVGGAVCRWRPSSLVGGNIGLPLIDRLEGVPPDARLVLELSSFQLELCRVSPTVAALLNVRPNHLDVHGTMEAYVAAKRRIYRFQTQEDVAVFGVDDPGAAGLLSEAPGRVLGFRASGMVPAGAGVADGWVWWAAGDGLPPRPVLPVAAVRLPGQHNLQNVAAAVAIAGAAGAPLEVVADVVAGFRGVEHRLEPVRDRRGVLWVNDSIATAPDRVAAALDSFAGAPLTLLAGGYDKGLPFDELAQRIAARVRRLILFGAASERLARAVAAAAGPGSPEVVRVPDLAAAVAAAAAAAAAGEVVLLSPACASFDQFRDFEERGQRFKALVAALPE